MSALTGAGDPQPVHVTLLDADGRDREISADELDAETINDQRLVWVDLPHQGSEQGDGRSVLERLGVSPDLISSLLRVAGRPRLFEHEAVMRLEVTGLRKNDADEASEPVTVLCLVGANWLVTAHDASVDFLDGFRERAATAISARLTPRLFLLRYSNGRSRATTMRSNASWC